MNAIKRATATLAIAAALAAGAPPVAMAAPTRIDPGDHIGCFYFNARGALVLDWRCAVNFYRYA